jgi:hypothetical protein
MHIDCAIVDLGMVRPDFRDELRTGQSPTFVLHQELK